MTYTQQAEQLIADGMAQPYGYKTRYAAAAAALAAVAYNMALDTSNGRPVTEGQLGRFRALDAIVKAVVAEGRTA